MTDRDKIAEMFMPVRCRWCGEIYDLGTVTVTARYADCSVWNTPCCSRTADDREWKSMPDYTRIDPRELDGPRTDMYGRRYW
jgi:hypothetical protein